MKWFIALSGLFLMVNCGGGSGAAPQVYRWATLPIEVQVDDANTQAVLDAYNEVFATEIFVAGDTGIGGDPDVVRMVLTSEIEHDPEADGYTNTDTSGDYIIDAMIGIRDDLDDAQFQRVLAHELGHVLGLSHTTSGLMTAGDIPEENLNALLSDSDFYYKVVDLYGL